MSTQIDDFEFRSWNYDRIKQTLLNIIPNADLTSIEIFRQQIEKILNYVGDEEYPQWFLTTIEYAIRSFLGIVNSRNIQSQQIAQSFYTLRDQLIYGKYDGANRTNNFYTLPFIENYARAKSIEKKISELGSFNVEWESSLSNFSQNSVLTLETSKNDFKEFKVEADKTLELLHKEAGKIGVKNYADIFENQAFEHSHFLKKNLNTDSKWKIIGIGKAQYWIISALIFMLVLVFAFSQLDVLFNIKGATVYTPEITVHILGRIVFISIFIFLISFSFKQYRVNMHLYTLNKHRANTLKSFEYLTRAPDTLDPSSYNAILMEVAKAIYEAGQTGYISSNESSGDLPSIIDMTKVFNAPRP
jgi:uncharacterized integral membrane protein